VRRVTDELSRRGAYVAQAGDVYAARFAPLFHDANVILTSSACRSLGCSCVVVTSQKTWTQDLFRKGCGVSVVSWNWVSE
jgi:hypothetical protein